MSGDMNDRMDDLDRALLSEEALVPSSGFAGGVMDAVRAAAVEPPPLPFPWARFLLGVLACIAAAAATTVLLMSEDLKALREVSAAFDPVSPELGYAAIAALATLLLVYLRSRTTPPDLY
jgi:hypothetical protein